MYRSLDAEKIIETVGQLRDRIHERFPHSGLSGVAGELVVVACEARQRAEWVGRPLVWLRSTMAVLLVIVLTVFLITLFNLKLSTDIRDIGSFAQTIEAGINDIVLIGAAVYFLLTVESRLKRRKALKAIHELRSLAHIVDMHQLTKDPERVMSPIRDTASSPKRTMNRFELARYLDYCSEMLSIISKLAALYVQRFDDPVVLGAVDEVEALAAGLSRKVWQKISLLDRDEPHVVAASHRVD